MTKKDFILLAKHLRGVKGKLDLESELLGSAIAQQTWRDCVMAVMLACEETNPNFDHNMFVLACSLPNVLSKKVTHGG